METHLPGNDKVCLEADEAMTDAEINITFASLRLYRTGLGLDEETTRRIIVEVAEEGEREPAEFRDEVRKRMLAAASGA